MRCINCGHEMQSQRETVNYVVSGLPYVRLENVEVRRCMSCGEEEIAIPRIESLHRLLAHQLVHKKPRFTGEEVRFLRKYLGWSGADFARHMGVTAETVSRWEQANQPIGPVADRLLRLMVLTREPETDYSLTELQTVAQDDPAPARVGAQMRQNEWVPIAVPA